MAVPDEPPPSPVMTSTERAQERVRWRSLKSTPTSTNHDGEDAKLEAYLKESASCRSRLERARSQAEQEAAQEDAFEDAAVNAELLQKFKSAMMIDSARLNKAGVRDEMEAMVGLISNFADAKRFANSYNKYFSDLGQVQLRTAIMGQAGWHRNLVMMRSLSKTLSTEARERLRRRRLDSGASSAGSESAGSSAPPGSPLRERDAGVADAGVGAASAESGAAGADEGSPTAEAKSCSRLKKRGRRGTSTVEPTAAQAARSDQVRGRSGAHSARQRRGSDRHVRVGYHDDTAVAGVNALAAAAAAGSAEVQVQPRTRRSRRSVEAEAQHNAALAEDVERAAEEQRVRRRQEWQAVQRARAQAAAITAFAAAAASGEQLDGVEPPTTTARLESTRPSTAPLAPAEYAMDDVGDQVVSSYDCGVSAVLVPGRRDLGAKRDRAKVFEKAPLHALSEAPPAAPPAGWMTGPSAVDVIGAGLAPLGAAVLPGLVAPTPSDGAQTDRGAAVSRREVWVPRPSTRSLTSRPSTATLAATLQQDSSRVIVPLRAASAGGMKRPRPPTTTAPDSHRKRQMTMRTASSGSGNFQMMPPQQASLVNTFGHPQRRGSSPRNLHPPSAAVATAAGGSMGWPLPRSAFDDAASAANAVCFGSTVPRHGESKQTEQPRSALQMKANAAEDLAIEIHTELLAQGGGFHLPPASARGSRSNAGGVLHLGVPGEMGEDAGVRQAFSAWGPSAAQQPQPPGSFALGLAGVTVGPQRHRGQR